MADSIVDGASSYLFSFIFRYISMVENHHWRTSLKFKDPSSIEASQASFHQEGIDVVLFSFFYIW